MKYTITKLESKDTSKGTILKVDLKDESSNFENGVTIWNSYGNFSNLKVGSEINGSIEIKQNGQYTNKSFKEEKTNTLNRTPGGIKAAQERKAEFIEKAQDRKNESISFFNSTNCAIALIAPVVKDLSVEEIKRAIIMYRDFFLSEWKKYERSDTTDKHDAF